MGNRPSVAVPSLLWYLSCDGRDSPIATVRHVTHAWLLIAPTVVTDHMTSVDHFYCGARGTRTGATSTHNSNGPSDISCLLLLPPTVMTGNMTSDNCCHYAAHGLRVISILSNSSDGPSNISESLLLPSTVAMSYMTSDDHCYCWTCDTLLGPTVATGVLTKVAHRYWPPQ
jgi:hypothetical protein